MISRSPAAGWRFAPRLAVLMLALAAAGCGAADPSRRAETTLDVVYDRPEPVVRKTERNIHFHADNRTGLPVRHLLIETEARTSFRWNEKGVDGTVSIKARRYRDREPEGRVLYAFESAGIGVSVEDDFVVVTATRETSRPIYRHHDIRTGKFLFESYGEAARMSFIRGNGTWTPAIAGFSASPLRILPSSARRDLVVGTLAFMPREGPLSELLLVAGTPERAAAFSSYVDEQHRLTWIDKTTARPLDPVIAEKRDVALRDVVLRLSFRASAFDLDFPVTADGFDHARLRLPNGLSLVPLERRFP